MGQVRKDILNGWKEIGGYVSRDIRTVERWEKQRGLPVRRIPGAGRATVYALISELDEWLENAPQEEPPTDLQSQQVLSSVSAANGTQYSQTQNGAAHSNFLPRSAQETFIPLGRRQPDTDSRQRWVVAAIGVAAAVVAVIALPAIRNHAKPLTLTPPASPTRVDGKSAAPYRSRVPGVDDLYLRGVYSYEQRTPESLQRSLEEFTAASVKDPGYAPAYAGLANTYNLLREYSVMPDAVAYPKARQAAEHAIALDSRLPDAHAALGFIDFFWSWDATSAEREFHTALTLDPESVVAHHWYGSMLMHQGRFSEAIEQLDIAQRLEPNSAAILSTRAYAMGLDGHRHDAVDMLEELIHETPESSSPHAILATLSNLEPRDPGRFLIEMRRSAELRHDSEGLQVASEALPAFRSGGERGMWEAIFATEQRLHPAQRSYRMMDAEAALGRNGEALTDLRLLIERHDAAVVGLEIDPLLIPLHTDPRFKQLAGSVGLPALGSDIEAPHAAKN